MNRVHYKLTSIMDGTNKCMQELTEIPFKTFYSNMKQPCHMKWCKIVITEK